jgi:integrase
MTRYKPPELRAVAVATKRLLRLYADFAADKFGPIALQAVRSMLVAENLCRHTVNGMVHRLRSIWKWGVRQEIVPETVWRALLSVPALAEDEEGVRESTPVGPAPWRQVRAVLRNAPGQIPAMVRLQILTGMRPGEIVLVRPCDVDRGSPASWIFRPPRHKTRSRGKQRIVQIGPRAQRLLTPLLDGADPLTYVFRPELSMPRPAPHHRQRAASRDRLRRRRRVPRRTVAQRFDTDAYRRAIQRACDRVWPLPAALACLKGELALAWKIRLGPEGWADVVAWRREHVLHPHQLRHSFATRIGNRFGEEEAQVLLGHSRLQTTGIYVQRDIRRGRRIIAQVG